MFVCAHPSPPYPTGVCTPDSFLLPARNTNVGLRAPSVVGSTLIRIYCSDVEILPLRVSSSQLCWWVKPTLGSNRELTLPLEFLHPEAKSLQVRWWDYPPLGNNVTGLPSHSQDRPTTPVIKISTSKRRDHFNSKKPSVKQARKI